jgi:predicted transcriptional regulator
MNPSKFVKNSKIHQALNVLAFVPMTESELKKKIDFTSSMPRFNEHIIMPLTNGGYVHRDQSHYKITEAGKDLLEYLGIIKIKLPASVKFVPTGSYDGTDTTKPSVRVSGDDHFRCPSRRGDMLFYRDGRVEAI